MKWRDNQELLKENPGGSIQATCGCLIKAAETWVNQANAAVPSRQSIRNISDHGQTEKLRMSTPLETREKRDGDNEKTKTNRSKLTYLRVEANSDDLALASCRLFWASKAFPSCLSAQKTTKQQTKNC